MSEIEKHIYYVLIYIVAEILEMICPAYIFLTIKTIINSGDIKIKSCPAISVEPG
jgi:hypothetical protein